MLTCEAAETLVVQEADDVLTAAEREALDAHAAGCEACRALREVNVAVKRAVALRVDAPAPSGFAERVSERLRPVRPAGWLDAVDWRRWTGWMLPVAAALVLVAVVAGGSSSGTNATQADSAAASAVTVEAWSLTGDGEGTAATSALGQDVTDEELLAAMLGARVSEAEGKSNGR